MRELDSCLSLDQEHGLNEELGRHSDRDGKVECMLCGAECESVVHMLWECSSYGTCRDNFQEALKQLLGAKKHHMCSVAKTARMTSTLCCI